MAKARPPQYFAYMLRFWPENQPDNRTGWRFALVDSRTGKQLGFPSLEALTAHLALIVDQTAGPPAEKDRIQKGKIL